MKIMEVFDKDEFNLRKERVALNSFMEKRGYKFVGQGNHASVFESNRGFLVKVYGETAFEGNIATYDPLVFYRLCKKINNKFVPKFGNPKRFTVNNKEYIALPTEKLSTTPTDFDILKIVHWIDRYPLDRVMNISKFKPIIEKHRENLEGFFETVEEICNKHDCGDLFATNNIMYRGNTPVINDPWYET